MSILITGGAGYVGSHTAHALAAAGYEIAVADNLCTGFRAAVPACARFYQGDIRDRAFLDEIFSKESVSAVIHFAALSQVGESMTQPLQYYHNNLYGTQVLLESMLAHGVQALVFSSSAAVYGEAQHLPIRESDPTQPTNCYGATKLAMEQMMHWVSGAHGLRFAALRYFNACGAQPDGQIGEAHCPETHLIPLVLQVALGQRPAISLFGTDYPTPDGTCIRDYVHVCDLAQAHILAMQHLLRGGDNLIVNLGSGTGFSVREIIDAVRRITGHAIPVCEQPRRAGDPAMLVASTELAQATLGWNPVYSGLDTIIDSAWTWHRAHPNGYSASL